MTLSPSRYRFREDPLGFSVEGDNRPPVRVAFRPTGLEAWCVGELVTGSREQFGFYSFGKLLQFVARGLMRDWQPRKGWYGARTWAHEQTARAIARRLREQWLRLVGRADATVAAVQKTVFAATFGDAPLASEVELYRDRYLVQDILHYPAAATALRNAWMLTRDLPLARLRSSAPAADLRRLAHDLGLTLHLGATIQEQPTLTEQLDRLRDWKALYSHTRHDYRSLNRTLMNLPGRVPHRLVCNVRRVHLERPLGSRLELLCVVLYAGIRADREGPVGGADHGRVLQHARAEEIKEAMRRVSLYLRQPLEPRKSAHVRQLVQFLADCPEPHAGNVVGLAEKSIRWHRSRQHVQTAAMWHNFGGQTAVMTPPIDLPAAPGVSFLGTVSAICTEAEQMHHCVASYVEPAVRGNCYLFHVRHKGEEATIEVGCEGRVRQAQGPRNQRNAAAIWGKRVLARWAAKLPLPAPEQQREYWPADDVVPF
jgi:hypothetical protein